MTFPSARTRLALAVALVALPACLAGQQKPESDTASVADRLKQVAADLFSRDERVDDDIATLKSILGTEPNSAEAHMLLGIAYRTKGTADLMGEAAGELRQALSLDPSLIPAHLYLAHLYLDLARPERAKEELQTALAQMPGQAQLLALLGETDRELGDPTMALDLTGQALQADSGSAEARYYHGLALYDLGRHEDAIGDFEQALKQGGRRPEVYANLGRAYIETRRFPQAIASLIEAIKLDPSRAQPMIELARAYRLNGQLGRVEAPLTHARALIGDTAVSAADQQLQRDLYLEEGLFRLALKQLPAAERSLQKVVDLDSSYGPGHRYLAEVLIRQGLYTRAQDQALRAEKLGSPLPADLQKTLDDKLRASHPKGQG